MTYYSAWTGEEYKGPFPDPVVNLERIEQDGMIVYREKETGSGDPEYKDELDRWLFTHENVLDYPETPEWAVTEGG